MTRKDEIITKLLSFFAKKVINVPPRIFLSVVFRLCCWHIQKQEATLGITAKEKKKDATVNGTHSAKGFKEKIC